VISGIAPRPIALVSTIDEQGVENISPFSWFNMVTNYPPIISIACNHRSSGCLLDTATNMMHNQGFTVNILSEPFVQNANATCIDAPPDFDEWSISGLTKGKCVHVKASRVKESAFSMECELYKTIDITHPVTGEQNSTLILAHVRYIHVRKDMLTERGVVDLTKFKPVACMDDVSYVRVGSAFTLTRPSWAQEEVTIQGMLKTLASL